jgi:hypothetical protein
VKRTKLELTVLRALFGERETDAGTRPNAAIRRPPPITLSRNGGYERDGRPCVTHTELQWALEMIRRWAYSVKYDQPLTVIGEDEYRAFHLRSWSRGTREQGFYSPVVKGARDLKLHLPVRSRRAAKRECRSNG